MTNHYFPIKKAAVLGAGVMGAQIAAHLANAGIEVLLYDLPGPNDDVNQITHKAIKGLSTLKPAPLSDRTRCDYIEAANYATDLKKLTDCNLIIEAIAEQMPIKVDLYHKIAPFIQPNTFVTSNTSGLSINKLAEALPDSLKPNFCGMHFFNPPRYMQLVELIPHQNTEKTCIDALETFLVSTLGKGVVRAKDTPNFIANRVGVFCYLAIVYHAKEFGIPVEIVDQLTGPLIGRPKSATFRTFDVIGLDTFTHVVNTMKSELRDDPWHAYYEVPEVVQQLVSKGALGQKTQAGFYKKVDNVIHVYDPINDEYVQMGQKISQDVVDILNIKQPSERFQALKKSDHKQAKFLWACYRDLFHYVAYHLSDIADTARCVDFAMRWGFGWQQGPFETWQNAGWQPILSWLQDDIASQSTMSSIPLPEWASSSSSSGVHTRTGSFSPLSNVFEERSPLPVYQRQYFPVSLYQDDDSEGETIFESDHVRLWCLRHDVGILSFKSKLGSMGLGVLEGIHEALSVAEKQFKSLVIWQDKGQYFSVGANLKEVALLIENQDFAEIERYIYAFQQATLAISRSVIPVVAAVEGYALGGGCELMLHCDKRVFALETLSGLVELGVGLIPAGGGCKQIAKMIDGEWTGQSFPSILQENLNKLITATMCTSAHQLKSIGFNDCCDVTILNSNELLYVAQLQAQTMAESSYRPNLGRPIKVLGTRGIETIQHELNNLEQQGKLTSYDKLLGEKVASVLCGGEVPFGTELSEQDLLDLERQVFVELVQQPKTKERIDHMLKTGKKLNN